MRLIERKVSQNPNASNLWIRVKLETLAVRPSRLILEERRNLVRWPEKGKMYLFLYLPENQKSMKYFDRAPLVLPIDRQRNTRNFRALNFHYIFPQYRYEIITKLLENGNDETRVKRNLDKFLRYANGDDAATFLKTYSYNNCRSMFLEIPINEWEYATALPIEHFKKKHKSVAWKDTRRELL